MFTRREFATLVASAVASVPVFTGARQRDAGSRSMLNGVRIGAPTYSFRDLTRPPGGDLTDPLIQAFTECGLGECELWSPQIEPAGVPREEVRRWRLETPLDHFSAIGKKFGAAGIVIRAFNYSFNDSFTEAEMDRGFDIARAMGADFITASSTLSAAKRLAPLAEKYKMIVAMHNHSNVKDPNEFATPESFAAAMKMSPYFKVNLDIGHFTAANFDAVAYLREHHAHVTNLHIKDRKRDQGPNMPWGEGDTPIRDVLRLLQQNKWPITANLEYEYKGAGTPVEEVKKGIAFMRKALA